ncbi:hypothetical protein F2Q70_00032404 [Brassica cretica]|uniref:non-specific serine/threonine protein kinase n=1 Tax=Brassica cretica TaxID=69181 RepID=A0A8S9FF31_BRACR|nr:hypothetical protein F2Q70_00032404 [Brassica cretica]
MGHCYSRNISAVEDDEIPEAPDQPPQNHRHASAPQSPLASEVNSYNISPLPAGVSPSPARTPGRKFKWPFPPPSPAKPIMAALRRRRAAAPQPIPEDSADVGGGGESSGGGERLLDKNFGFGKNFEGKYELGKEVGRGHFGHTCWAKAKKGKMKGQKVAVKIIAKAKMTSALSIEDVRREVKLLKALSGHRHMVKFYDAYEDDNYVFVVMELCEGGELLDRILARGGRYTEVDAKRILVQILSATAFFHLQGVVHRDLKPENFLFTSRNEDAILKVIDFGLSDFIRYDQRLNDVVGSAFYVAPEVLHREVKLLKALSGHRHMVKFYDAYEDDNYVFVVMELCEGGELLDRILARGGRYTEVDAKRILVQILSATAFFHLQGVVHRDLKPENFLFTSRNEDAILKVIDFGLSDFIRYDQRLNDVVGSAFYVAPEVLHRSYSTEADMWSIGVISYILLCGSRPFHGRTESAVFRCVIRANPNFQDMPWPSISHTGKDFVKRLLNKDHRKRMTAAQALAHPWLRDENPGLLLDFSIYRLVKSYIRASHFRRLALKALSKAIPEDELVFLKAQFMLLDPKDGGLSLNSFTSVSVAFLI